KLNQRNCTRGLRVLRVSLLNCLGSLSLPIYLPGTNYYRGFKVRQNVSYDQLIYRDVHLGIRSFNLFVKTMFVIRLLSIYATNVFCILECLLLDCIYATQWTRKEHETMHKLLIKQSRYCTRDEHISIRQGKNSEQPLDWDDYKSMRFTRAVVFETMRLANVVNVVLRMITREMKLNGFLVPKGWRIYVYTREVNYDPILYQEPLKFNPWRLAGGTRLCPGKELSGSISRLMQSEVGGSEVGFARIHPTWNCHNISFSSLFCNYMQ
ncbi:cytochrome P450 85A1, partial [Striga asiatica]